jgi:hypothetical protein
MVAEAPVRHGLLSPLLLSICHRRILQNEPIPLLSASRTVDKPPRGLNERLHQLAAQIKELELTVGGAGLLSASWTVA